MCVHARVCCLTDSSGNKKNISHLGEQTAEPRKQPQKGERTAFCLPHSSADCQHYPQFYEFHSSSALTWLYIRASYALSQKWHLEIFACEINESSGCTHQSSLKIKLKSCLKSFSCMEGVWTLDGYVQESMNQLSWWLVQRPRMPVLGMKVSNRLIYHCSGKNRFLWSTATG